MSGSTQVMRPEPLPAFGAVQLAAAGFLARYSGRTREAYVLDLRAFFAWCTSSTRGTGWRPIGSPSWPPAAATLTR